MDPVAHLLQPAPDFTLIDVEGAPHRLSDQTGRIVVLNFWSAECPWARRLDDSLDQLRASWPADVILWPIASNANESPAVIASAARVRGLPLVLLDSDQSVADLYGAVTTPHCFVIDRLGVLRYAGAFDDVTLRQRNPSRYYLAEAVAALLAGRQPDPAETPPYGCALVRYPA